ncbi:MAG: ABC transporter permease [Anaerolineales bacterium]|nr:ABC transporter permease [Anaerolineales bacterium]
MRTFYVFLKTCREMSRDWWMLGLTLAFAPFFIYLYWLFAHGGSTSYRVLVVNNDQGAVAASGEQLHAGEGILQAIDGVTYADGKPLLKAVEMHDQAQAEALIRDHEAVAFVVVPPDFSRALAALGAGERSVSTTLVFGGDLTNPYYMIGATLAITAADAYVQEATGQQPIVQYVEKPLGGSATRTEFELYAPGIIITAAILLIFLASMVVAREVEAGTLRRLRITPMTSFDLLGGITAALTLVGVASVALTFHIAVALGFRSQGPLWIAILVGALTSLSVIGVGLIVACFSKTVSQAFVIANFPLGALMFLSGSIFPLPKMVLFTIGGQEVGLYDVLPPTHAVAALNKVLTLGAGLGEVAYEMTALLALSVIYFAIGVWLFQRTQMR